MGSAAGEPLRLIVGRRFLRLLACHFPDKDFHRQRDLLKCLGQYLVCGVCSDVGLRFAHGAAEMEHGFVEIVVHDLGCTRCWGRCEG